MVKVRQLKICIEWINNSGSVRIIDFIVDWTNVRTPRRDNVGDDWTGGNADCLCASNSLEGMELLLV